MSSSDQTSSTDFTAHSSNFSDYVIGVIDRRSEAKVAAAGLLAAGFEGDDVVLSPEASSSAPPLQPSEGMEGSLAEPPTTAQELFTEEGILTANMRQLSPAMTRLLGSEGVPVLSQPFDIEILLGEVSSAFARMRRAQP